MARILAVAKDLGAAGVVAPLVKLLKEKHEVSIVLEGLASGVFREHGLMELLFQGSVDFKKVPFTLNEHGILSAANPDLVVTGLSSPINLEDYIARAANFRKIPLVCVEDIWGSSVRTSATPQHLLVYDHFAAREARKRFPEATITIVGNSGVNPLQGWNRNVRLKVEELRQKFGRVVVYVGGGLRTTKELELLVACITLTDNFGGLIAKFHPKYKNTNGPDGRPLYEVWSEILEPLRAKGRVIEMSEKTDEIVVEADITTASFSTLLTTALAAGKTAIVLDTPEGREDLEKQTGLTEYPHVALGLAPAVDAQRSLDAFGPPDRAFVKRTLAPYDPKKAADAIEQALLASAK